jgi:hypothetical protein
MFSQALLPNQDILRFYWCRICVALVADLAACLHDFKVCSDPSHQPTPSEYHHLLAMTLRRSVFTNIIQRYRRRMSHTFKDSWLLPGQPRNDMNSLFCYTSGRWLWNEREQLEARYRQFDVPNLQRAACQAVGVDKCLSIEKIGEGNYNKAYRLEMADGKRIVAKVPHPNAGPRGLTTASEVATMEFVRTVLNIPVPKVLAWSATDHNPVRAEYIIMEEAKGTQLHGVWQDLPLRTKSDIIREFVDVEKKLLSVSFDMYDSACFSTIFSMGLTCLRPQSGITLFQGLWYCWMRTCYR